MTRPITEPTPHKAIRQNRWQVKGQRQKPAVGSWVTPDCDLLDDDDPRKDSYCTDGEPPLQNSWAQPTTPLELFAFRLNFDGALEFKGHLDSSGGAVSGTVAVTLPGATDGDANYLPPFDHYAHTVITTDDGTNFMIALVFIDATTGDLTITWPAL